MVAEARMRPPFLAKPLWADGRDGAHGLAVVHDEGGLAQLVGGGGPRGIRLPVMLQQYVEHGGCLFKARLPACDLDGARSVSRVCAWAPAEFVKGSMRSSAEHMP